MFKIFKGSLKPADYDRLNDCNDFFKNNSDKIVDTTNDAFDSLNVLMNNPPYNF